LKPINFKESNVSFAENQPEYLTLHAHKDKAGIITSCWKMSFFDRMIVALTGRVFVSTMTFNHPLQPLYVCAQFADSLHN